MKQLQERGIYSLALTPYQYTAYRHSGPSIVWLLVPEWPDNTLIGGPTAYVLTDGRIGVQEGVTRLTVSDLDFTGRYQSE